MRHQPSEHGVLGRIASQKSSFGRDRESFTVPVPVPLRIFPRCIRLYLLGSLFHHQVIHVVAWVGRLQEYAVFDALENTT